ncbi:hypothetical protein DL96DRAFT_1582102 [Flagelloscypha sp. PMI_526]|nr:hypothetical protein DL96DRAFT_1582102 [Flagelloscypha sp. PMI_526]
MMNAKEQQLRVLRPFFPPSLLVCLMTVGDLYGLSKEGTRRFLNFVCELDDRLVVCMTRKPPVQNQWILVLWRSINFIPRSEEQDTIDAYWARGLTMIIERRRSDN